MNKAVLKKFHWLWYVTQGSWLFLWLSGKLNKVGGWTSQVLAPVWMNNLFICHSICVESISSVGGGAALRWHHKSWRKNTESIEKCTNTLVLCTCQLDDILPLIAFRVSTLLASHFSACGDGGDLFVCFVLGNKTLRLHVKWHLQLWWLWVGACNIDLSTKLLYGCQCNVMKTRKN